MGDVEETATVLRRVFPVALGDIKGDGCGCTVQLVFDIANPNRLFQEHGEPGDERDGFPVNFQFLMIKPALFGCIHLILSLAAE